MTQAEMMAKVRKESGIGPVRSARSIRDWQNWLLTNADKRLQNLGYALRHGMATGRFTRWTNAGDGMLVFQGMTNGQVADAIGRAAYQQAGLNTADGLKALNEVFGGRVY